MQPGLLTKIHRLTLTTKIAEDTLVFETVNYPLGKTEFNHSTIADLLAEVSVVTHPTRLGHGMSEVIDLKHEVCEPGDDPLISVQIKDLGAEAALWAINNDSTVKETFQHVKAIDDDRFLLYVLKNLSTTFTLQPVGNTDLPTYEVGGQSSTDINLVLALAMLHQLSDRRYKGSVRIPMSVYQLNCSQTAAEASTDK